MILSYLADQFVFYNLKKINNGYLQVTDTKDKKYFFGDSKSNLKAKLKINYTNKNDIIKLIGPPSTKSSFDNDIYIYIERKTTVSNIRSLGKKKLLINNVLVLEFDQRGLLLKKDFYNKDQMNKIKIAQNETKVLNKKNSFIRSILISLRQKINEI